jgi:predicted transcriptional regulator
MLAKDVMSSPVISIGPQMPVLDIAQLLVRHRIGGLPVIVGNELIGIVTESDLLHRHEIGTGNGRDTRSWWHRILGSDPLPTQYIKSHGNCARYVMTRDVVFVEESTPLSEIATIFELHGIGRVPVVAGQKVVGIVTCADLVKTMVEKRTASGRPRPRSDETIKTHLAKELEHQTWWNAGWSSFEVTDGAVEFTGLVETESQKTAARVAAENIEGVAAVVDRRLLSSEISTAF